MALARVHMHVESALGREHAARLGQTRHEEAEVVVVGVVPRHPSDLIAPVACSVESDEAGRSGIDASGPHRPAHLRTARVERRVYVDEVHGTVRDTPQRIEVVAEDDEVVWAREVEHGNQYR